MHVQSVIYRISFQISHYPCCCEMDVLRTDHMEDYILERTAMPDENIRKAQGETVFDEEQPLVCPFVIYRFSVIPVNFACIYRGYTDCFQ